MATLPTKTPCPRLPSMAAAWSSKAKLCGGAVLAAKRTPSLSIGKGGRSHGRDVLLALSSRNCNNSTLACSFNGATRSSSFYVHVGDSGAASSADYPDDGIGIKEFLGAKNFLITGGTGFLAKVLIEKILRTNPEVAKIYVLIRAKDIEGARKRLQNEVVDTDLFIRLKEIHGNRYHSFVERKLVPVVGDIMDPNIGIAADIANEIAKEVDIIVNSAANTTFNERYDVAIDTNTLGPFRIMSFAQRLPRLKLFLHVSTAYANGQRQGIVLEKPFLLGDTIATTGLGCLSEVEANTPLRSVRRAHDLRARAVEEMVRLGRMYEPYTFYGGRFDNTNMEALFSEMSEEERARFDFDFGNVDWMDYFTNVHIPGLRKHVMKGRGSV